jgi:Fic family protein
MITRPPQRPAPDPASEAFRAFSRTVFLALQHVHAPTVGGRYHHWHGLRRRTPPAGLQHGPWWFALKTRRGPARRVPLQSTTGDSFQFVMVDEAWQMLHNLDSRARGHIGSSSGAITGSERDRYLVSSLQDEAIHSSMLEGAVTTHRKAKLLLRSGRKPRTKSEQMIVNNLRAIEWLRERKLEPLTPGIVLDTHARMTEGTLDEEGAAGRLRRADEDIVLRALDSDEVVHTPPPAADLAARMQLMCDWANDTSREPFVHPVVRSIVLHFWLAYDHPFVDGNGRTARALFYWSMLRHGYWLVEFLPVSRQIHKAPAKYARAFQYVETDDNDLTYFVLNQLGTLSRAIDDLHAYLARKSAERQATSRLLRHTVELNHRQIALIEHALGHRDAEYTIEGHRRSHAVVYQSARTDLLELERRGLLLRRKDGRKFVFVPAERLELRLQRLKR